MGWERGGHQKALRGCGTHSLGLGSYRAPSFPRRRGDEMRVLKGTCVYHYLPLNLRAQHPMAEGGKEHYCMGTLSKLSGGWNTINLPTLI